MVQDTPPSPDNNTEFAVHQDFSIIYHNAEPQALLSKSNDKALLHNSERQRQTLHSVHDKAEFMQHEQELLGNICGPVHPLFLYYRQPIVEAEFTVFYYQDRRHLINTIITVAISVLEYSLCIHFLVMPLPLWFTLIMCGISLLLLLIVITWGRTKKRFEQLSAEAWVLEADSPELKLFSEDCPVRCELRRNADMNEKITLFCLCVCVCFSYAVIYLRPECGGLVQGTQDFESCQHTLNAEAVFHLMIILAMVRFPRMPRYLTFLASAIAGAYVTRALSPDHTILVNDLAFSMLTFCIVVAIASVCVLTEVRSRVTFEHYVQQRTRAAASAWLKKQTEQTLAAQVPPGAGRAESVQDRDGLWGGSPSLGVCGVSVDRFREWGAVRSAYETVKMLSVVVAAADEALLVSESTAARYHTLGDLYLVCLTLSADPQECAKQMHGLLKFAAMASISCNAALTSHEDAADMQGQLRVRSVLHVGEGTSVTLWGAKNVVLAGPVMDGIEALHRVPLSSHIYPQVRLFNLMPDALLLHHNEESKCPGGKLDQQDPFPTAVLLSVVASRSLQVVETSIGRLTVLTSNLSVALGGQSLFACTKQLSESERELPATSFVLQVQLHNADGVDLPPVTVPIEIVDNNVNEGSNQVTVRPNKFGDPFLPIVSHNGDSNLGPKSALASSILLHIEQQPPTAPSITTISPATTLKDSITTTDGAVATTNPLLPPSNGQEVDEHPPVGSRTWGVGDCKDAPDNSTRSGIDNGETSKSHSKSLSKPTEAIEAPTDSQPTEELTDLIPQWLCFGYKFRSPELEADFIEWARGPFDTVRSILTAILNVTVALVLVCLCFLYDDLRNMDPDKPLLYAVMALIITVVRLLILIIRKESSNRYLDLFLFAAFLWFYTVAIIIAPHGTAIANTIFIFANFIVVLRTVRPTWFNPFLSWITSVTHMVAFIVKTSVDPVGTSFSFVTSMLWLTIGLATSYRNQQSLDLNRREEYLPQIRARLLMAQLNEDYERFQTVLQQFTPDGIAAQLIRTAKSNYTTGAATAAASTSRGDSRRVMGNTRLSMLAPASVRRTTDPSQRFALPRLLMTGCTDTMFLLIGFQPSGNQPSSTEGLRVVASAHRALVELLEDPVLAASLSIVKASMSTVLITVDSGSVGEGNPLVLLDFVSRAHALLRGMRGLQHRVVVSSGPVVGCVLGSRSVSFEYYGAAVCTAQRVLEEVPWGVVVATPNVLHAHAVVTHDGYLDDSIYSRETPYLVVNSDSTTSLWAPSLRWQVVHLPPVRLRQLLSS